MLKSLKTWLKLSHKSFSNACEYLNSAFTSKTQITEETNDTEQDIDDLFDIYYSFLSIEPGYSRIDDLVKIAGLNHIFGGKPVLS
uniref:Uncharacterized protein n=1 Tax=Ditylenchus dipsaci TaxID=166011 RepID=A0A915D3A4_9BILA